jgi:hypothetical protein
MEARYVVDESGKRTAIILGIEEYERLIEQNLPLDDDEAFDPEEAERRITGFVESADELPGPSVADLVEQAAGLMRKTWDGLEAAMQGKPHNKVLATQLLLSQRARSLQPADPEQWRLYAATTLLSGMISAPDPAPDPARDPDDARPPA